MLSEPKCMCAKLLIIIQVGGQCGNGFAASQLHPIKKLPDQGNPAVSLMYSVIILLQNPEVEHMA